MKLSFFSLTIVFLAIVYLQNSVQGQLFKSTGVSQQATKPGEEHDPFQTRIMLGLGLGGVEKNLDFVMVDENGFEFDTMSLLKHPNVRNGIGMDEAQYSELYAVWEDRKRELTSKVRKDALDLIEAKDLSKAMFLEGEVEMRELLSAEQLLGLEQARVQLAIQRHGAAAALGASDVREQLGLTDSDVESIKQRTNNLDQQVAEFRKNETAAANQALLEKAKELATDESLIGQLIDDEQLKEEYVKSELFPYNKATQSPKKSRSDILRLVKLKSVRNEARITEDQYEQIKELQAESRGSSTSNADPTHTRLKEILSTEQLATLNQTVVVRESKRVGTVSATSHGFMAKKLGLTDETKKELFEFGVELQESVNEKVARKKSDLILASLSEIPEERRQAVVGFFDSAITFLR